MQIHIKPIWTDDDTMMEVQIQLAGNGHQSWIKAYAYPEAFENFGQALVRFPQSVSDEVRLELGSTDPAYGEYLVLRAFVYDGLGHCAIEFKGETRGDALRSTSVRFAVPTEAASVNELGQRIVAWASAPNEAFLFAAAEP